MKVIYDYSQDTMSVAGVDYQLSGYRKWLLINHESLCQGHFIKALKVLGKTKFYFDWQMIFLKSYEYQFLKDYIHDLSTDATRES